VTGKHVIGFALAVAACVVTAASAAEVAPTSPKVPPPIKVRSTLDGRRVLPQRIRWVGFTTLARARVRQVSFLIDGKIRWIEQNPPYSYDDDGGYLTTTWLIPGAHRFTVRVRATDGRVASRTVVARVVPAPPVPEKLAGSWQRDVQQTTPDFGGPLGIWTLTFERRWIQDRAPGEWNPDTGAGGMIDNYWLPGATTFDIDGSVSFKPYSDADAEAGWWCKPSGPKATYSWSVQGDTLVLAPLGGEDRCRERGDVYTGTWTRVRR